jgi:hypothetical protein
MRYFSLSFLSVSLLLSCGKTDQAPGAGGGAAKSSLTVNAVEGFVVKTTALTEKVTASGNLVPEFAGRQNG